MRLHPIPGFAHAPNVEHIADDLAEANRLKDQSDAALADYEKALADARARAQALANETRERLNAEAEGARKALEAQLNVKLAEAERIIAATKAGMGLSALPALAASPEPDLVLCAALPSFASPVWLCYHESRKDDPLLRTVATFLGDKISETGGR